jgi:hypothetical protein
MEAIGDAGAFGTLAFLIGDDMLQIRARGLLAQQTRMARLTPSLGFSRQYR